jgi:hypothetical protein
MQALLFVLSLIGPEHSSRYLRPQSASLCSIDRRRRGVLAAQETRRHQCVGVFACFGLDVSISATFCFAPCSDNAFAAATDSSSPARRPVSLRSRGLVWRTHGRRTGSLPRSLLVWSVSLARLYMKGFSARIPW